MEVTKKRPYLIVIPGGKSLMGPADRLNLFDRFPKPDLGRFAIAIASKLFLLGSIFYLARLVKLS